MGSRKGALPAFIAPHLATLVDDAPTGDAWLHEVKPDGYRLLVWIDGARIKLLTRRGNGWTEKFEPLVRGLAGLKLQSAMLDGEIVHLMPNGTSSFGALQEDLSEERPDRLCYFLFDLLALAPANSRQLAAPSVTEWDLLRLWLARNTLPVAGL